MTKYSQRGFGIVAAVFVIAIALLIVLAAALTSNVRSRATVSALESSQAFWVAQGGLEIASGRVLTAGCGALPSSLMLEGYTLNFTCSEIQVQEEPDTYSMYLITVKAKKGLWSNQTFVSKTVRSVLTEF